VGSERCYFRAPGLAAAFVRTPKSFDFVLSLASRNPSLDKPRLSSSRIADARLGILRVKRQSSTALSSGSLSMICNRSARPLGVAAILLPFTPRDRDNKVAIYIFNVKGGSY
jgi:hypothetical protein